MLGSLRIAQIGLQAQKTQLDAVAQNLSNASTPAYKRVVVDFASLLYPSVPKDGPMRGVGGEVVAQTPFRVDMTAGELRDTGNPLDIAIAGEGFIEVQGEGATDLFWRGGRLQILDDGSLATADGHLLKTDARVPVGTKDVRIGSDGTVSGVLPGETTATGLGAIELISVSDTAALAYSGPGLFSTQNSSVQRVRARPGELGMGSIATGKVEFANVQLVDETVNMMMAQRVYELNAKVAQAADEIMALTNSLRK